MNEPNLRWEEFARVDLRVGRVLSAEVFDGARKPAYILQIDFGPEIGIKKTSAQLTVRYTPEDLIGRLVVGVVNFPKKQIGSIMSECLVTGFPDGQGGVIVCQPGTDVPLGSRLY